MKRVTRPGMFICAAAIVLVALAPSAAHAGYSLHVASYPPRDSIYVGEPVVIYPTLSYEWDQYPDSYQVWWGQAGAYYPGSWREMGGWGSPIHPMPNSSYTFSWSESALAGQPTNDIGVGVHIWWSDFWQIPVGEWIGNSEWYRVFHLYPHPTISIDNIHSATDGVWETFTGRVNDASGISTDWRGTVDYGDGFVNDLAFAADGTFTLGHTFGGGTTNVTVSAWNLGPDGNVNSQSRCSYRFAVTAAPAGPSIWWEPWRTNQVGEGEWFNSVCDVNAPASDYPLNWTIDWGDGTVNGPFEKTMTIPLRHFAWHQYAEAGEYQAWMSATDADGASSGAGLTIEVLNAAPEVSFTGLTSPVEVAGGTPFEASGSFTDASPSGSWRGEVDYGDGSDPQVVDISPDKTFSLSHTYEADGYYTVQMAVIDEHDARGEASILVTVQSNHPPLAVDDSAWTHENEPLSIPVATLLANDSDPDGDALTLTVGSATNGTATRIGEYVVFTPETGFLGDGGFGYTIEDGRGLTASASVVVRVLSANQTVPQPGIETPLPGGNGFIELPGDAPKDAVLTVTPVDPKDQKGPPSGFRVGAKAYYEITMEPPYTGDGEIKLTLHYDDTDMSDAEERRLRLRHWDDAGGWGGDITWDDPSNPDIVNDLIIGYTKDLSPFAVFGPNMPPVANPDGAIPSFIAKLVAPDGSAHDTFGWAVAVAGDTMVVGAPYDDPAGEWSGAAYVYVRSATGWLFQQKLTAFDGEAHDEFGKAVAVTGDTLVVAAAEDHVGANYQQGSAYVFVRSGTTWSLQQKLTASDGAPGDRFGYSIAMWGDTIVAGARDDNLGAGSQQGSAYVFVRSGSSWTEQAKLVASDAEDYDQFGGAVSISGDTAVVGSWQDNIGANANQGSAYVFVRSGATWALQQKLVASDGAAHDGFGVSVVASGDTVAVGAIYDAIGGNSDQGSAYVFVRSGAVWAEQAKLVAPDGDEGDYFARPLALEGDTLVAGATRVGGMSGPHDGAAYVFTRSGVVWSFQQRLRAFDGVEEDYFGYDVAVSGDTIVVTATSADIGGNVGQGAAYVYAPYLTPEDTPITVDLIANDTDPESDPLSIDPISLTDPAHGTATLMPDGRSVRYEPDKDWFGEDAFFYRATDGTYDSNAAKVTITVTSVNDPPMITIDPQEQTVQYSDPTATMTVDVKDIDGPLYQFMEWTTPPTDVIVGAISTIWVYPLHPGWFWGEGHAEFYGLMKEPAGDYPVTFTASDTVAVTSAVATYHARCEDAKVTSLVSPIALRIDSDGMADPTITGTIEQADDGYPGVITNAKVEISLVPVGPGPTPPVLVVDVNPDGSFTAPFSNVPINCYTVIARVTGGYFTSPERYEALTVYNPAAGFATGGGWFIWPDGSGDKVSFGFVTNYVKNAKGVRDFKGSLVLIRHTDEGEYRLKSNALVGLSLGEVVNCESFGWAAFTGKATFAGPRTAPIGNYTFQAYVEDRNEPGTGTDRFYIKVRDKDGMVVGPISLDAGAPATAAAMPLAGGNVTVPHKAATK